MPGVLGMIVLSIHLALLTFFDLQLFRLWQCEDEGVLHCCLSWLCHYCRRTQLYLRLPYTWLRLTLPTATSGPSTDSPHPTHEVTPSQLPQHHHSHGHPKPTVFGCVNTTLFTLRSLRLEILRVTAERCIWNSFVTFEGKYFRKLTSVIT